LKYVARMRREGSDFHLMICKHVQCLRSQVDGTIIDR
jgi:hypothetical protein